MFRPLPCLLLLLLPALALAADVEVKVGESKDVDVGAMRGLACDDLSIANAEIHTDPKTQTNQVTVTGVKVGRTRCRVGDLAGGLPHRLIEILVREPQPKNGR